MYLCTHRSTQVASPTLSSGSLYMATHLRKHCSVILRAREKRKSTHPECCNAAPRLISPPGWVLHSSNRHRRGHRWRAQEKRSVEASAAAHLLNISVIASSSVCCAACMLAEKKTDRGTSCCVGRPCVAEQLRRLCDGCELSVGFLWLPRPCAARCPRPRRPSSRARRPLLGRAPFRRACAGPQGAAVRPSQGVAGNFGRCWLQAQTE